MNIDIDIADFRAHLQGARHTILSLHKSGQANLKEYETSKKELSTLNSGLTWTEKYLGGSFGGDKEKVRRIQSLKEKISKLRAQLKKIDSDLKSETSKVKNEIVDYLSKNSKRFKNLSADNHINQQLLHESNSFLQILKKAKKGISDALLFTSWENLLNHPKAQLELEKFNRLLENLQEKINQYETQTGTKLLNGDRLGDYIQFSTEKIAMDSFRKLNDTVNAISNRLTIKVRESETEISTLTDIAYQSIVK